MLLKLYNVYEEYGEGKFLFFYECMFLELLDCFGVDRVGIDECVFWFEVCAFNVVLVVICMYDDVFMVVVMLGIIEDLFLGIFFMIGEVIVV